MYMYLVSRGQILIPIDIGYKDGEGVKLNRRTGCLRPQLARVALHKLCHQTPRGLRYKIITHIPHDLKVTKINMEDQKAKQLFRTIT